MNSKSKKAVVGVTLCFALIHALPGQAQRIYEVYCQNGLDDDNDLLVDGDDPDCQCFIQTAGDQNCTANDIGFVVVGLGTQTDGCVNQFDSVGIQFGATIETTATTRYDIGMWVALDGGDALTGVCARQTLTPAISPQGAAPTAAQLNSGSGPFRNQDGDACADVQSGDDPQGDGSYNALYVFKDYGVPPGPFTVVPEYRLQCADAANGVLDISTCISYDNNANTPCSGINQALPNPTSKCRCQGPPSFQSNIPVPNVQLTCDGCTVDSPGNWTCDYTYTNTGVTNCNQTSDIAELEFACGTARYMRFRVDYPESEVAVPLSGVCIPSTSGTTTATCPGGTGRGDVVNTGSELVWTPRNDVGAGTGTLGWIGVNESERLRFIVQQLPNTTISGLNIPIVAEWSNAADFSNAVQQDVLSCSIDAPTPVTLQNFQAEREGGDLVFSWTTSTESGNAGFNLLAETGKGSTRRINALTIPARGIDSLVPHRYQARVPAAGLEGARFFVEDVSTTGRTQRHGPFSVGRMQGAPAEVVPTDWQGIRAEHQAAADRRAIRERAAAAGRPGAGVAAEAGGKPVSPVVQIHVDRSGIQRVTYEALVAAGAAFDHVKATDLVVENLGAQVPIYVGGDRFFGPGSYVEFVGESLDTLYTDTNVYVLRVDRKGARAAVDTSAPSAGTPAASYYLDTVEVEHNGEYSFSAPEDPWFDRYLTAWGAPTQTDLELSLDHVVAGAPASLTVALWGVTDWPQSPDHHLVVSLNGTQLADELFDGLADHPVTAVLPVGTFAEGTNALTLLQPGDTGVPYDYVALESYSITYPRAFVARNDSLGFASDGGRFVVEGFASGDIVAYRKDASGAVTRLAGIQISGAVGGYSANLPGAGAGATYLVASGDGVAAPGLSMARDTAYLTSGAADYLVISHPDFMGGLDSLVQLHEAQGMTVKVADVRDVFDRFGYGIFDPIALRDYVAYAAANMGTRFVLLVGGDSYDYFDYSGVGAISFVPTLYARSGEYVNFAPADALLGDTDGDGIQDLAVGRMPVRTLAELTQAIDRTLAYESKSYRRTAVFSADGFDAGSATSFTAYSEGFRAGLGGDWETERAYVDNDGVVLAKSKLVNAVNGGVAFTSFIGHSGPTVWTFQGLFRSADAAALENEGAPTVVSQYGCWNAYFVSPAYDSLAHAFLLSGDRGAAAVLGATTLTENRSDRLLGNVLTPLLAEPGRMIGDAVVEAKRRLAVSHPGLDDIQVGFTVLGDPALVIEP